MEQVASTPLLLPAHVQYHGPLSEIADAVQVIQ